MDRGKELDGIYKLRWEHSLEFKNVFWYPKPTGDSLSRRLICQSRNSCSSLYRGRQLKEVKLNETFVFAGMAASAF